MSDLISRKALYKEIARLEELARNRVLDTPSLSPCYTRYSAQLNERTSLKHLVADAPTAFNVDKVVEQLKECERYVYDAVSDEGNYVIDAEKAIEIVKGAVKDE